jgi:hypothetical protein
MDKPIHRAVICVLDADPEHNKLHTVIKPVVFDDKEGIETHESPERDLVVIATCLGSLVRQVEEHGYMKKGQAMQAAMDTLNKIYITNDIDLILNGGKDNDTSGTAG